MNNGWLLPPVALFPLDLDREMARRYVHSASPLLASTRIRSHLASGSTDFSKWARVSSGLSSRNARYNDRTSHCFKIPIHPMLPSKKYHQRWIRVSWSTWRGICLSNDENALRNA